MPIYVYETVAKDMPPERFEFFQSMSDAPLKRHPENGQPIRRVPAVPSAPSKGHAPQSTKKMLNDNNLERMGFSKYVKSDDGKYERAGGKGPDLLDAGG